MTETDIKEDKTFFDYIVNRFIDRPDVYKKETQMDDKIFVRNHLSKDFADYLPEAYFTDHIRRSNFKKLPKNFVIKPRCCQNGKAITIVKDGINLATNKRVSPMELKRFYTFLKSDRHLGKNVVIEELLFDKNVSNKIVNMEYNFFVFGGIVKNITVVKNIHLNKEKLMKVDYDLDWNRVKIHTNNVAPENYQIEKPDNLEEMIELAGKLGAFYSQFTGIPFVRVDLYDTNNGVKFGEFSGDLNGNQDITEEYQQLFLQYWKNFTNCL